MPMRERARAADWVVLAALGVAALAPAIHMGSSDFTYPDASRHAMDGVFLLDALREMPSVPVEWAKRYYVTSPALGFGRYPPLGAALAVPFYVVLGPLPFAGRLAGALVWLVGLAFFYETLRRPLGRIAAAFGALALASGPASVRWAGEVMLELPATAFLLAAACCYWNYVGGGRRAWLTSAAALACLGGWVKQPAALALPLIVAHAFLTPRLARPIHDLWPAALLSTVILAPLVALSLAFGDANMAIVSGAGRTFPVSSAEHWLVYVRSIPDYYLGRPATVLAVLGLASAVLTRRVKGAGFWAGWIVIFYAFFTAVGLKSPRLAMLWTPGLAFFAAAGLGLLIERTSRKIGVVAAAVGMLAVVATYVSSAQNIPDREASVRQAAVAALDERPGRILYAGPQNGTFVFRIREMAGYDRPTVVRDSKTFYADSVVPELGRSESASTPQAVRDKVSAVAPDVVVVEEGATAQQDLPIGARLFREYVKSGPFDLLSEVQPASPGGSEFRIYRYLGPKMPANVEIPMPAVGRQFELPPESP
jgi:hypothetical protein